MPTVKLSWTPRIAASSQRVYRSTNLFDLLSLPSILASLPGDGREYIDSTADVATQYFYGVSTVEGGLEVLSTVVSVTTEGFTDGSQLIWDQLDELAEDLRAVQENGDAILL